MFGSGKAKELESRLITTKMKLEEAEKENSSLDQQLKAAKSRIQELEKKLEESEGTALQEQARRTIVEYEGLKDLYIRKTKELEDTRAQTEESFAVEAANKRHDLSEEIRMTREENQNMVSETVRTFKGSYQYYLDQIRGLMDALSEAAKETGESLFDGNAQNIKERFGARILEHLQNNAEALKQDTGDLMLIGAEETAGTAEEAAEEVTDAVTEAVEEAVDEVSETAEEAVGDISETAEEVTDTVTEAVEETVDEVSEAVGESAGAIGESVKKVADGIAEAVEEKAKEIVCAECPADEPAEKPEKVTEEE